MSTYQINDSDIFHSLHNAVMNCKNSENKPLFWIRHTELYAMILTCKMAVVERYHELYSNDITARSLFQTRINQLHSAERFYKKLVETRPSI